jgi:hypothetical protein
VLEPSCGLNKNAKMRIRGGRKHRRREQHTREITEASSISLVALPALASCREGRVRSASKSKLQGCGLSVGFGVGLQLPGSGWTLENVPKQEQERGTTQEEPPPDTYL